MTKKRNIVKYYSNVTYTIFKKEYIFNEKFLKNNGYNLDEVNYMITNKARIDILETESDLTSWDVDTTIWMG